MDKRVKGGLLKPFEVCEFTSDCLVDKCLGKNNTRDTKFSCGLRRGVLISKDFKVIYGKTIDELDPKISLISKLKQLDIQDKFKIVEATEQYPLFGNNDINIDDEWNQRIAETITAEELERILSS